MTYQSVYGVQPGDKQRNGPLRHSQFLVRALLVALSIFPLAAPSHGADTGTNPAQEVFTGDDALRQLKNLALEQEKYRKSLGGIVVEFEEETTHNGGGEFKQVFRTGKTLEKIDADCFFVDAKIDARQILADGTERHQDLSKRVVYNGKYVLAWRLETNASEMVEIADERSLPKEAQGMVLSSCPGTLRRYGFGDGRSGSLTEWLGDVSRKSGITLELNHYLSDNTYQVNLLGSSTGEPIQALTISPKCGYTIIKCVTYDAGRPDSEMTLEPKEWQEGVWLPWKWTESGFTYPADELQTTTSISSYSITKASAHQTFMPEEFTLKALGLPATHYVQRQDARGRQRLMRITDGELSALGVSQR